MREEFKILEGETRERYIYRIYSDKIKNQMINKECADIINTELGANFQESYLRGIYTNYAKGYEDCLESVAKDNGQDMLNELEEKRLELEKEKIRFQDQKREYRNYLRADARFEHLVSTMKAEILQLNEIKPLRILNVPEKYDNIHAVMINSDWHTGIKEKNYWNEISVEILRDRVEKLQNKVIRYCKQNKVSTLHLEILGDMINGIIHLGTRISNEEDVISQTMICAEILADMIRNLAENIYEIKIYSVTGNHGRCVANAKDSIDTENFERMIPWYLKSRLNNVANIEFCGNVYDDNIIVYDFLNETIFAVHGHEDRVGTVINDLSNMLKIFPTEIHMGHYHSYYEKEEHDMVVTVNGTASGVDKYAKHIRKTNKPLQTLMIYNSEGRECTYKIKL